MLARLKLLWQKLARLEKAFLIALLLDLILAAAAPASILKFLVTVVVWTLGAAVLLRLARRYTGQLIWRLRNRLIVAYVFIAVVPVLLIVVLVASAVYVITGQAAVYLISAELERLLLQIGQLGRVDDRCNARHDAPSGAGSGAIIDALGGAAPAWPGAP